MSTSEVPKNAAIYSAVPLLQRDPSSDEEDGSINSLLSTHHHQRGKDEDITSAEALQESYNSSFLIFGMRSGFAGQVLIGACMYYGFGDDLENHMECIMQIAAFGVLWTVTTLCLAAMSSRLFKWIHQAKPEHYTEQDFHLIHGSLIGMYMAWIIFDLILAMGPFILCFHSAVALIGHLFLQRSKKKLLLH